MGCKSSGTFGFHASESDDAEGSSRMDGTATGACSYVTGVGAGGDGAKLNTLHGEGHDMEPIETPKISACRCFEIV